MDHALQTISYIADIDDILVVMARQGLVTTSNNAGASEASEDPSRLQKRQVNICCHVFESVEVRKFQLTVVILVYMRWYLLYANLILTVVLGSVI